MKIAQHYSLKKRLIWTTSIFSLLLGCLLIFAAYKIALHEVDKILDQQMQYVAERSSTQLRMSLDNIELHQIGENDLLIDISASNGKSRFNEGFYTEQTPQGSWRVYVLPLKDYMIQVKQQEKVRQNFAWELVGSMFTPYFILLPFAILVLAFIIHLSLQPLDEFKAELIQRDSEDLTPVDRYQYPQELIPTIEEMNRLFERIQHTQIEQKQFIADAAHELRTPITALNLDLKILMSQYPEYEALQKLGTGLARIQHLITQLLTLAKQDAGLSEPDAKFCLNDVALHCVEKLMDTALQKDIDLGFEYNELTQIQNSEVNISLIVFNLIENAIKNTPHQGMINISIYHNDDASACIKVEDNRMGIDPECNNQASKYFYQSHPYLGIETDFGLAIANKAALRIGGNLVLSRSVLGGLSVLVNLPSKV